MKVPERKEMTEEEKERFEKVFVEYTKELQDTISETAKRKSNIVCGCCKKYGGAE